MKRNMTLLCIYYYIISVFIVFGDAALYYVRSMYFFECVAIFARLIAAIIQSPVCAARFLVLCKCHWKQ